MASSAKKKKKFQNIFSSTLGRPWEKHFLAIMTNLEALNWNLKPGFLWDLGPPMSVEKLTTLMQELKKAEILSEDIYIVSIDTDIILVNILKFISLNESQFQIKNALLEVRGEREEISPGVTKFMDVGNEIDSVQFLVPGTEKYEAIETMVNSIIKCLKEFLEAPDSFKQHLALEVQKSWCVPTIFGLLLGYPVVYWYGSNQNVQMLTLDVYNLITEKNIALYAFSIPSSLVPSVQDHLENWCKQIIGRAAKAGVFFANLKLTVECVTLNSLVL